MNQLNHEDIFKRYIELFEDTFTSVKTLNERSDGMVMVGLFGKDPWAVAHAVGAALVNVRIPIKELPLKREGELFLEASYISGRDAVLYWRDPPIWDSFYVCKRCKGGEHLDGIDKWTKEKLDHAWMPERVYTLYMRYKIEVTDDPT